MAALAIVVMIGDGYCAFVSINLDRQVGIASAVHKDPGPVGRKAAFVGYQHSGNSAIFLDHSAKGGLKQYPGPGGDPPQAIGDGMTFISIKPVKPGQKDRMHLLQWQAMGFDHWNDPAQRWDALFPAQRLFHADSDLKIESPCAHLCAWAFYWSAGSSSVGKPVKDWVCA